jgi:hypothetical protein
MSHPTSTYTVGPRLTMVAGKPFALPVTWTNPDGTAINITGFTLTSYIKSGAATQNATVTVEDAAAGKFTASFDTITATPAPNATNMFLLIVDAVGDVFSFKFPVAVAVL